jgi:hypothetical protein
MVKSYRNNKTLEPPVSLPDAFIQGATNESQKKRYSGKPTGYFVRLSPCVRTISERTWSTKHVANL